ncbi:hypothetical protein [Pseudoalteromonas phenolica]|uniref:hypothetical protein n=1 Tax=Pseudoalteromonas phenolica TaxID=161398 RepID=UPI0013EE909A|nr:hypothetical protein [Pseudoalteromonas phenolica]
MRLQDLGDIENYQRFTFTDEELDCSLDNLKNAGLSCEYEESCYSTDVSDC